ncbi:CLIP-associating protein 2-like isoform X2 [Elysia marginata]|uniref:CLIP-associating protein 2-like isoform X2 n=1 Tax=Elysia marginata TaxID=1093978 RepID=A0AAV4F930_9GAST|nr:CLIP-associating protein 2-like isoform X2 [Elysia marginata]
MGAAADTRGILVSTRDLCGVGRPRRHRSVGDRPESPQFDLFRERARWTGGDCSSTPSKKSVHFNIFPYIKQIPARQRSNSALLTTSPYDVYATPDRHTARTSTRPRSGTSQSQPNSRSNSPSHSARRQLAYVKNNTPARIDTGLGPRRTRIPGSHSQGASREASPARSFKGPERRLSSGGKTSSGRKTPVLSQRVLRHGSDVEDALQDALFKGPQRRRYDQYDSDDAASETSSVCSERSHSSYGGRTSESRGRIRSYSSGYGATEDMHSIITQLGSTSYLDRKDGLLSLQHLLRSNRCLSRVELKKVTEIFTRMFHDPHTKSLLLFLDFHRDCFPFEHQFNTLSKFIVDQAQGPNLRVRVSMLTYLHGLIISMDPSDFVNCSDARLAVSKIIGWTNEPRNVDIRKGHPEDFELETENLNPEDIFNSIKQTSADIQSLNKLEPYEDVRHHSGQGQGQGSHHGSGVGGGKPRKHVFTSQDSGIQDLRLDSPDGTDHHHKQRSFNQFGLHSQKSSGHLGNLSSGFPGSKNGTSDSSSEDVGKVIVDILEELSNHNERVEQRKNAMQCLQGLIDKGAITQDLLENYFNNLLLILVETLGDTSGDVKVLALKCMQKMLQKFPRQFEGYAELVILRVLELHKDDTFRDVPYAASDVEDTIVKVLPPEQNFRILTPIIQKMEYHMACGAIQMMTKVVEKMPTDLLEASLPNLIPGLFKNFEHKESPVRKASCFCLVAIYLRVEEAMRPYMDTLNGHRMKLLNLYIKKRREDEAK